MTKKLKISNGKIKVGDYFIKFNGVNLDTAYIKRCTSESQAEVINTKLEYKEFYKLTLK